MAEFKLRVPPEDYDGVTESLHNQFNLGYLDPELEGFLSRCVPPANLNEVSFLRTAAGLVCSGSFFVTHCF